jgi:hypothetical protein
MTADPVLERPEAKRIPATSPAWTPSDRRRPGRLDHVSPALLGLLRARPNPDAPHLHDREAGSSLGAAQAIGVSAIVGALCWTGLIGLVIRLIG